MIYNRVSIISLDLNVCDDANCEEDCEIAMVEDNRNPFRLRAYCLCEVENAILRIEPREKCECKYLVKFCFIWR